MYSGAGWDFLLGFCMKFSCFIVLISYIFPLQLSEGQSKIGRVQYLHLVDFKVDFQVKPSPNAGDDLAEPKWLTVEEVEPGWGGDRLPPFSKPPGGGWR